MARLEQYVLGSRQYVLLKRQYGVGRCIDTSVWKNPLSQALSQRERRTTGFDLNRSNHVSVLSCTLLLRESHHMCRPSDPQRSNSLLFVICTCVCRFVMCRCCAASAAPLRTDPKDTSAYLLRSSRVVRPVNCPPKYLVPFKLVRVLKDGLPAIETPIGN